LRQIIWDRRSFDGIEIDTASIITTTTDHITPLNIQTDLKNDLRNRFNSLSIDEQTTFIRNIKDSGISTLNFPTIIQEAITHYERIAANGPFVAQIQRIRQNLERAGTLTDLETVRVEFSTYISSNP
jgi:hypothetical protein